MKRASSDWFGTERLRALHRVLALTGLALLGVLLAVLASGDVTAVAASRAQRADLCIETPYKAPFRRAGIADALAQPAAAGAGCWREVSLPYVSNVLPGSFATGPQPIGRAWFRVRYVVPLQWDVRDSLTVYVPRVNGWAWLVEVDGRRVADNLDNWRMTWNTPVVATLSPGQFVPGRELDVRIGVAYLPAVGVSAARITIGPSGAIGRSIAARQFLQSSMPQGCGAVLLLLGGFFFTFWLSRRGESAHLLVAAAAVVWCVCNLQYVVPRYDDPQLDGWYGAVTAMSVSWFMWLVYLFALRFDARRTPWIEWTLPLFVLTMSVVSIPYSGFVSQSDVAINAANAAVGALVTVMICARALRGGSVELRVIALALAVALLAGAHDVALLAQIVDPESVYLLPFAGVLIFGSFLFAVQRRYARAIEDHEKLQATLALRLAEQERQLNANHQRLRDLERKETLAAERQRLTYDIHDGVGSTLLTALSTVEKNDMTQVGVARVLRHCIDDLRLVIDSLDLVEHDVVALLATLRHRIGRQLDAAGLALEWDIQDLPALSWLDASGALNVLRIVQEALANVLKHAEATRVRIATRRAHDHIEIAVEDNGCGFECAAVPAGRGLKNQRRRAEVLGARLELHSAPGLGTQLRLCLPLVASGDLAGRRPREARAEA